MKQNTLKTLTFTIAMVCVGSLYGQTTRTFQRITSEEELTEGIYLIVGSRTKSESLHHTLLDYYVSSDKKTKKYNTKNITDNISSDLKTITIGTDGTNSPHYVDIQKDGNYYLLYDVLDKKYIGSPFNSNRNEYELVQSENATQDAYKAKLTVLNDQKVEIHFQTGGSTYFCFYTEYAGFSVYSTVSTSTVHPYLYKEVTTYNYSREIASTNIGTICLPYEFDVSQNTVAKFYEIAGKTTENGSTVLVFNQVNTLEAGLPYIFKPQSETASLNFTYTGIANPAATAGNKNGLYGTFADISDIKTTIENTEKEVYLVKNNIIQRCGIKNILYANRAYIVMSEVPTYDPSQPHAKAILRVPIDDSSTGIEEVAGSEAQPMEYHSVNGTKLSAPQKGLNIVKMNDGSTQKVFIP